MATLLLRLQGPLQSWGTSSRFDERETQLEPSKSGVLGLVCAALGRDRHELIDDLAALRMGVRVDQEGLLMRDFQTATGVAIAADGKVQRDRTVVSPRFYLADAVFLVGLQGADAALLECIQSACLRPVWPLCLGRKACLPSVPVCLSDGIVGHELEPALSRWPDLVSGASISEDKRVLLEDAAAGSVRLDQPIAPFAMRRFGPRFVRTTTVAELRGG
ncbi:type I-E CRISPR-associated protein Cas5/CasD [Candidimonas nitroreducens]|uniref:Type I-E CRISPR-associated protein Cas5/CasD n=1 Tax=Candidimonas nitroreducens TaxID=683354 RepID=A0A225MGI6_9BURK|nr:type I-E CRISPR-associated protein Cas5/CasD [Candidimonas nitroreducens]OWT60385.1 type I-E CRISPR-associated protein Cas5/CasD [Candidimonas nitroreducens]